MKPPSPVKTETSGVERYSTQQVVFSSPFTLGRDREVYPPGTYDVETRTEAVERCGFAAFMRTATTLIIPTAIGTISRQVQGSDLDEALVRDQRAGGLSEPSENPDRSEVGD